MKRTAGGELEAKSGKEQSSIIPVCVRSASWFLLPPYCAYCLELWNLTLLTSRWCSANCQREKGSDKLDLSSTQLLYCFMYRFSYNPRCCRDD